MIPPAAASSHASLFDSWIINTFPTAMQFDPGSPGLPPSPTPGPLGEQASLGLPRSASSIVLSVPGIEVSNILGLPSGVHPSIEVADTTNPLNLLHSVLT